MPNDTNTDAPPKSEPLAIAVPQLVQAALEKIDQERAFILTRIPHAEVADDVIALFNDRFGGLHGNVSAHGVSLHMHATSMVDVVALRRYLAQRGYHVQTVQKYPDEQREVHRLGAIDLYISFATEGASCRYVAVGTKTVPVYELRCDDAEVTP